MAWIQKNKRNRNNEDRRKERQNVYNTKRWRDLRLLKIQQQPCCEECGSIDNLQCHHKISPFDGYYTPEEYDRLAYDINNLEVLCQECHNKRHNGSNLDNN